MAFLYIYIYIYLPSLLSVFFSPIFCSYPTTIRLDDTTDKDDDEKNDKNDDEDLHMHGQWMASY